MKFQAIKGVRDILPPESALWNRVEQAARDVFATFGYGEIRLPIFEQTELFTRSIGVETDIVGKEMFRFPLREASLESVSDILMKSREAVDIPGGRRVDVTAQQLWKAIDIASDVALRPEATASVARAYIEHGMHTWPSPVRLYYLGPMFRRERPQKGRYRQFYQIGAELLGPSDDPRLDADVIEMLTTFFEQIGLKGTVLSINSLGDKECRPKYVEELRGALRLVKDKLGPDSQRRIETNPLRVLDSKLPEEQPIIEQLPRITQHLCDNCRNHNEALLQELKLRGIVFRENWRLARGLDYYMRTTFEVTAPGLGSQDAVCGGGRYDGLVELLGGPAGTKGIGFAIGTDRLILSLQGQGLSVPGQVDVLVGWKESASYAHAREFAHFLRSAGLAVDFPSKAMNPRDAIALATRRGIPICVVVGPDETSAGVYSVRFLADQDQVQMTTRLAAPIGRLLLFRVSLEKALTKLAEMSGIEFGRRSLLLLAEDLAHANVISGDLISPIRTSSEIFNRVVHGEKVGSEDMTRAVAGASFVLSKLLRTHRLLISPTLG